MVSRLPSGSPLDLRTGNQVVATFNKEFTRDELVGKLVAVIDNGVASEQFLPASAETLGVYAEYQSDENPNTVLLTDEDDITEVIMHIDGRNLVTDVNYALLFTIDYDSQHKKIFETTDGGYLLQVPQLIKQIQGTSNPVFVKTSVENIEDEGEVYLTFQVNNEDQQQGYQPICNNENLDDEDVGSWYNNRTGKTNFDGICELLSDIIRVEYNLDEITLIVHSQTETFPDIDGGMLNLLTDGSPAPRPQPVVPLQMVSRFPSGSPILATTVESDHSVVVCEFNRLPNANELIGNLKAVFEYDETVETLTAESGGSSETILFRGDIGSMFFTIDGTQLKANDDGDVANLWDIDFNEQHKKTAAEVQDLHYASIVVPQMETSRTEIVIQVNDNGGDLRIDLPVTEGANPDIVLCDSEGFYLTQGQWFGGSPATLVSLIREIIYMEYTNGGVGSTVETDMGDISDITRVNLFTQTNL